MPARLDEIAAQWRAVEDASVGNPFLTFDWMDAWWRSFGGVDELYAIVVEEQDGAPVGVAPFVRTLRRGPLGGTLSTLRLMGHSTSDRLGFLSVSGREREVAVAVVDHLRRNAGDWHVLELDKLPAESQERSAFADGFRGDHIFVDEPGVACPFLPIEGTWDAYLAAKSSNFRADIRRSRRRFERDVGGRLVACQDADEVRRALAFLFEHNTERFAGRQTSAFADPRIQDFHHDAALRLLDRGRLSCLYLEFDGALAAVIYDLRYGGTVWYYNTAFHPRWSALGLGKTLLSYAVEDAFSTGAKEFDFLLGDHTYKRRWTDRARQQRLLTIVRPHLGAIFAGAVPRWWIGLKRGARHLTPRPLLQALRMRTGAPPEPGGDTTIDRATNGA